MATADAQTRFCKDGNQANALYSGHLNLQIMIRLSKDSHTGPKIWDKNPMLETVGMHRISILIVVTIGLIKAHFVPVRPSRRHGRGPEFADVFFRLIWQKHMAAATIAMTAPALTLASAIFNVLFVEAEEGEVVFDGPVEEVDVGPNWLLVVTDAEKPLCEVVFAVFCAGSAVNPLSVQ
ncbi:hypothetical protein IFR05_010554 [Cadophora sp. M221]|nr:hypothetical protein IFR05_010554 [Cadophora sp. M221]